jgi:hypothetical protein
MMLEILAKGFLLIDRSGMEEDAGEKRRMLKYENMLNIPKNGLINNNLALTPYLPFIPSLPPPAHSFNRYSGIACLSINNGIIYNSNTPYVCFLVN